MIVLPLVMNRNPKELAAIVSHMKRKVLVMVSSLVRVVVYPRQVYPVQAGVQTPWYVVHKGTFVPTVH